MKTLAVALAARLALAVILIAVANTDGASLGSSEERIIGGQDAARGQFPWQVSMYLTRTSEQTEHEKHFCAGSIIDSQWVMTTSNCAIKAIGATMTFGNLLLNETSNETVVLRSSSIINEASPIALIKLPTPLIFSDVIQPVKLPRRSQKGEFFYGEKVTASGWGGTVFTCNESAVQLSKSLKFVELEIKDDNGDCAEHNFICTEEEKSAFKGDDGGPLVWKDNNGTVRQIGIFSSASLINEIEPGWTVILNRYTCVGEDLDWIVKKTGIAIDD